MEEDKKDEYKITVPIITNQELNDFDNMLNIAEEYESIFDKIHKQIYKDRECILLQKVIEKQQKDLENLIKRNKELEEKDNYWKKNAIPKNTIDYLYIEKSKVQKALGLDEDLTEEKILNYIDILVSENNRLENIEDKKVQIEYQNVFNKGVKSVEDKIREKIEILDNIIDRLDTELAEAYIVREKLGTEKQIDDNEQYIYNMEQERSIRHTEKYAYLKLLQEGDK